jgi:carboxyl-terminal processing protease
VKRSIRITIFLFGWPAVCVGQSPQGVGATRSDPAVYLNHATDIMQTKALRRNSVDWTKIRAAALAMAAHAESTAGAYDGIRFALASLDDQCISPTLEALEAEEKAKHPSPNPLAARQENFSPYVGRYKPEGHLGRRGDKSFAYVVLTKCFPENDRDFVAFETNLQRIVAELDASHPSGWIVDLRGNVGGNMWPMLAGIGPVLGEGENLGEFFNTSGHSVWRYRHGVAAEVDNGKVVAFPSVEGSAYHLAGMPEVAVLIDHSTGSSGEAIACVSRTTE